ncbi:MAG: DUF433 domain-containing protein [Gammaproteobacteria bacterium]|nr:MAG: DUF433 domain-containing protein [Gammaproteobacteria bacterium]
MNGERLLLERITVKPHILNGRPILREKGLTVEVVLALLAEGATYELVLQMHPDLEREDILACLTYASYLVAGKALPERFTTSDDDA